MYLRLKAQKVSSCQLSAPFQKFILDLLKQVLLLSVEECVQTQTTLHETLTREELTYQSKEKKRVIFNSGIKCKEAYNSSK